MQNDIDTFLSMFERKEVQDRGLAAEEVKAVVAYLKANVEEFALLGKHEVAMRTLVETAVLIDRSAELHSSSFKSQGPGSAHGSNPGTPTRGLGGGSPSGGRDAFSSALDSMYSEGVVERTGSFSSHSLQDELVLYKSGVESSHFVLILQGKVDVTTTSENFNFELGPWSVLGSKALTQERYVPDFTAEAMAPCRILKLEKAAYKRAVQQARLGLVLGGPRNIKQAIRKSQDDGSGGGSERRVPGGGSSKSRLGKHAENE
jgi:metal transporter CNNM